ncbi:hypothetical protein ILYODFUR_020843 [Ilyodon furcidens]|uniref:Uncharacterized protein n=1 Tax=Ilyodon furcidens TaxID=33524 RepID=A0ABV0TKB5_9TELE
MKNVKCSTNKNLKSTACICRTTFCYNYTCKSFGMCLFQLCKSNKPNKSLPILLCKITHAQSHRMESISKQQVSSVAATSQLTGLSQLLDFDRIMNIFSF